MICLIWFTSVGLKGNETTGDFKLRLTDISYIDENKLSNNEREGWLLGSYVVFYGVSIFGGYLMSFSVYTDILNLYDP